MADTIGKYRILDRIGRGGMGTIFKAHDPLLNRAVAIKVISGDLEVTGELRARFFREAQACARLSHPNIVTVYDMGEDDGRLFIVMEFLDGDDLRAVITQRRPLALEDKLSIMIQVCDGLHYAHQSGIVHRDITPSNILVLRNGQAKILDFGIAQIAAADALTRTGLIMGKPRYLAPEQITGRADFRSDIFSVGTVLYELVTSQPPFVGDHPMQVLEEVRTVEPPPVTEIDPDNPPELAAVIQRAMRKHPAERFTGLDEMRAAIERVQRGLAEEAQRLRDRVGGRRDEVLHLQEALVGRGASPEQMQPIPAVDERARLSALRALERDLDGQVEALHAQIARADSFVPVLQRGAELLRAGHAAAALVKFQRVIEELPGHDRARELMGQARAALEAERQRQQLTTRVIEEARSVLETGAYALCLELLRRTANVAVTAEVAAAITALREQAATTLAAQEAVYQARQQAEQAREQMTHARRRAQAWAASRYAEAVWSDGEAKRGEAEAALAREAYAEAGREFEEATALYRIAEDRVHDAVRSLDIAPGPTETPDSPAAPQAKSGDASASEARPTVQGWGADVTRPSTDARTVLTDRPDPTPDPRPTGWRPSAGARRAVVLVTGLAMIVLAVSYWSVVRRPGPVPIRGEMVLVPAGEFMMGSNDHHDDEKPLHRVYLNAYYIDKYETTNALYRKFMDATGWQAPMFWDSLASEPVVGVSWDDAIGYCRWAGKRLPTEAEWEKAARGTDGRKYPWGDQWDPDRANWGDRFGLTMLVGSYRTGASPYGAQNMAGNVWEWAADWYAEDYYERGPGRNLEGPGTGTERVLRGGSWSSGPLSLRAAMRGNAKPYSRDDSIGFRCAKGASFVRILVTDVRE